MEILRNLQTNQGCGTHEGGFQGKDMKVVGSFTLNLFLESLKILFFIENMSFSRPDNTTHLYVDF